MAWTTPRDWTNTETVTEAIMDTHVRDNLLALKNATRQALVVRSNPDPVTNTTWENAEFEVEIFDDMAAWSNGTAYAFFVPAAGRFVMGASVFFSAATGTGSTGARIKHFNSGAVLQAIIAENHSNVNEAVNLSAPAVCAAGDFFLVETFGDSTGTPHSWTGRAWLRQDSVE